MLGDLRELMRDRLLALIRSSETAWQTLEVGYEKPRVERVWVQLEARRLSLHRIHPCERALFHPHPWPSAVMLLTGSYEMRVGFGAPNGPEPEVMMTQRLVAGCGYEMLHPRGWHSVSPLGRPSLSLMLTDVPWATTSALSPQQRQANVPLSAGVKAAILEEVAAAALGFLV